MPHAHIFMEDQTQKIMSLQEELIQVQKTSYNGILESMKKIEDYKKTNIALLIISFLSLAYALTVSLALL